MKMLFKALFGTSTKDSVKPAISPLLNQNPELAAEKVSQGNKLLAEGKLQEALAAYRCASVLDSANSDAKLNLAFCLSESGEFLAAEPIILEVLGKDSDSSDAHFILASIARQTHRLDLARVHYLKAIELAPNLEPAYVDLAYVLFEQKDIPAAEALLLDGYARFPKSTSILSNLGAVYLELQQPDNVRRFCEEALLLDKACLFALSNLGVVEAFNGDPEIGIKLLRQALDISPMDHELWLNYGMSLVLASKYDLAREAYQYALHLQPEFAAAHTDLGLLELLTGNLARGWVEHEWRLRQPNSAAASSKLLLGSKWDGSAIHGSDTLLLHCEQGIGDTLQFLRFVPEVLARHNKSVLLVQKGLKHLASQFGVAVLEEGENIPPHDLHCSLMSLPFVLGHNKTAPALWTHAYLQAATDRAAFWSPYVHKSLGVPRIGITWSGNPKHRRNHHRSIALSRFAKALPANVNALCLQPSVDPSNMQYLSGSSNLKTIEYPLRDFADTSAIIAELDLVISVDTSVAHLAAAMGKPVWLLVAHVPDWRWLTQGNSSQWYPSIRLFRQPSPGDWETPIAEIHQLLQMTQFPI